MWQNAITPDKRRIANGWLESSCKDTNLSPYTRYSSWFPRLSERRAGCLSEYSMHSGKQLVRWHHFFLCQPFKNHTLHPFCRILNCVLWHEWCQARFRSDRVLLPQRGEKDYTIRLIRRSAGNYAQSIHYLSHLCSSRSVSGLFLRCFSVFNLRASHMSLGFMLALWSQKSQVCRCVILLSGHARVIILDTSLPQTDWMAAYTCLDFLTLRSSCSSFESFHNFCVSSTEISVSHAAALGASGG